jgi:hypothetical protein
MATFKRPTNGFDQISLGSVATCKPDISSRLLHGFLLKIAGTGSPTLAEYIEYVEIEVNGKKDLRLEPAPQAKLDAILNSNGDTLDTTMMYVPFTRPGQRWSPWGTADIKELNIKAKIVGSNPSGKTLTALSALAVYSPVAAPMVRGDYVAQTIINPKVPVAGWNTIDDLPNLGSVSSLIRMVMTNAAITEVKIEIGERLAYHMTLAEAKEGLARNPMYKLPSGYDHFPVILDDLGIPEDFHPLIVDGIKQPVKVEYYWDTDVAAVAVFKILVEGLVRATPVPVATAKA